MNITLTTHGGVRLRGAGATVLALTAVLTAITTRDLHAQFDLFKEIQNGVQAIGEGVKHVVNEADKIRVQTQPIDVDFKNGGVTRFNWGGLAETRYDPRNGVWSPIEKGWVLRAPEDFSAGGVGQGIRYSRDRARSTSVPVPLWVRQALAPFFTADVLQNAQYTFDWGATANFTAQQVALGSGGNNAIALIDTIVFRNRVLEVGFYSDQPFSVETFNWDALYLWAHEFTHLEQYRTLGVEEFARWLIRDYDGLLENPAKINGDRVAKLVAQSAQRMTNGGTPSRCQPGSGALFLIEYPGGRFQLFGDCHLDAYRYYPEYGRREERPSGRIVVSGQGYSAVDSRGNWYFARLIERL